MLTKLIVSSILLLSLFVPTTTFAQTCDSRMSGQSPAVKMLQRQLSALRSIQRGRGCKPGDTGGGFFNACRDVEMKINEVKQDLRATAAANNECQAEARTTKATPRSKTVKVFAAGNARPQPATNAPKKARGSRNVLSYCVRLSDGYYFPTPNSQYEQKGGTDAALTQCKIICKTDAMAVYIHGQNEEAAEMVSVQTGEAYANLTTAYDYHGEGSFERCDWNGYVSKVNSLLVAQKQTEGISPKPATRPHEGPLDVAKIPSRIFHPARSRVVRIVGPAFIPDANNAAFDLMRPHPN